MKVLDNPLDGQTLSEYFVARGREVLKEGEESWCEVGKQVEFVENVHDLHDFLKGVIADRGVNDSFDEKVDVQCFQRLLHAE